MSAPAPADRILAAGAVLWRANGDGLEVALVHRPKYDDWSLPKGKLEPGEQLVQTAVREVNEETGHTLRLGRPLGATVYYAEGRPKRVTYWAAEVTGGRFTPHKEVDRLEWWPVAEARHRVDRDEDRSMLEEFERLPVRTRPVVVVRHAIAVSRDDWTGDEQLRPLTPEGEEQSRVLAELLPVYAPTRVITSPSQRCRQTIAPYAERAGLTAEEVPVLSEDGHADDREAGAGLLKKLLEIPESVVVCTHRPVLPGLLATLAASSPTSVEATIGTPPLAAGEFVVAHVADGKVIAAERHSPSPPEA